MICDLIASIGFSDIFNCSNLISIKISSSCLFFLSVSNCTNKSIASLSILNKYSNSISLFLLNFSISSILSFVFFS